MTAPAATTRPTARPGYRLEKDPLGWYEVPADAYYGVQTARALVNFPLSRRRGPHPAMVRGLLQVKKAAARANHATGRLADHLYEAIVRAADEALATGEAATPKTAELLAAFVVDPYGSGAGTSHNMNANEVLANRAIELLAVMGGESEADAASHRGDYARVSPNDHVNMAQSTNDVIPTSMRVATLDLIRELLPALDELVAALDAKAAEFDDVLKSGRTHMQDAVPIRLGQEFAAWALTLRRARARIADAAESVKEQNIGATAVGTGLNAEPRYIELVVEFLSEQTGHELRTAESLVQSTQSMRPMVEVSSALRGLAVDLIKLSEDLRLISSGPRTGFAEIQLPAVQPGSSIMPGKVNPVMAETLSMVSFHVIGNDLGVAWAASAGQLELNVMMPMIAYDTLESIEMLANVTRLFAEFCVNGITVDRERCELLMEQSSALATPLAPYLGYALAADISKEAVRSGKTIRELVLEKGIFTKEELDQILSPHELTEPGVAGGFRFTPRLPEGYEPPTGPVGGGG
jgi:aspartate ammonia-lyase